MWRPDICYISSGTDPNPVCHTPTRWGPFDWAPWWDFLFVGQPRGNGEHVVLVRLNHKTNQKPENSWYIIILNTHTHTHSNDDCNSYLPQRLSLSLFLFLTLSLSVFHFISTVTQPWTCVPKKDSQFIVLL